MKSKWGVRDYAGRWIATAGLILALSGAAQLGFSQALTAPESPSQSARPLTAASEQLPGVPAAVQNPFLGAVATSEVTPQEIAVSLTDAIERGLRNNLGQYLSKQDSRAALGRQWDARSGLLPHLDSGITESAEQTNLAAFGFSSFPGIENTILGPFGVFDSRIFLRSP